MDYKNLVYQELELREAVKNKEEIMLFKSNTIIRLGTDAEKNETYMINVTTKKCYSHFEDYSKANVNGLPGYIGAVIILGISEWLRPQLYLNNPSGVFKILLVFFGGAVGIILARLIRKKIYITTNIDEYLEKHPEAKEVKNVDDISGNAAFAQILTIIAVIGFFVGSIFFINQFLDNSNLGSYFWFIALFTIFSCLALLLKHSLFILYIAFIWIEH